MPASNVNSPLQGIYQDFLSLYHLDATSDSGSLTTEDLLDFQSNHFQDFRKKYGDGQVNNLYHELSNDIQCGGDYVPGHPRDSIPIKNLNTFVNDHAPYLATVGGVNPDNIPDKVVLTHNDILTFVASQMRSLSKYFTQGADGKFSLTSDNYKTMFGDLLTSANNYIDALNNKDLDNKTSDKTAYNNAKINLKNMADKLAASATHVMNNNTDSSLKDTLTKIINNAQSLQSSQSS